MLKILHNNTCSKSRNLVNFLTEKKVDFEVVDILKHPLSEAEILEILKKGIKLEDLARTGDAFFKENFSKEVSDEELINILSEHPKLIQRPIVIKGEKALIARPMELVEAFL